MARAAVDRRQRVVVALMTAVIASSSLVTDGIRAVEPSPDPSVAPAGQPDADWREDGARVTERAPVPIAIPEAGGEPAGGAALDPSVGVRGTPTIDGLPADLTPAAASEIEAWRTEHSKSVLNPDGSITAEYSGGRLNYLDTAGDWQPLDLSLLAETAPGGYEVEVTASDRQVHFSTDAIESALAELASGPVSLKFRALDFDGVLSNPSEQPTASIEPSPQPSAQPSAEPDPQSSAPPSAEPAPTSPPGATTAPSAEPAAPDPSSSASTLPDPSGPAAPALAPDSPEPSDLPPLASPTATPEPTLAPTPFPSPAPVPSPTSAPSLAPTPTPPPVDPSAVPTWVLEQGRLTFAAGDSTGTLIVEPADLGFEFSVALDNPNQAPRYAFAVDIGGLDASLAEDGQTIVFEELVAGEGDVDRVAAGQISAPVLLDSLGVSAPPDTVTVGLFKADDPELLGAGISAAGLASLTPTEILVTYAIDQAWLNDPTVTFPVTLDPTVCIQAGASGCTSVVFETYVGSGQPTTYPNPPSMLRVGYDDRPDVNWGYLRSMVYFGDVPLPDGAHVTAATLDLEQSDNLDGSLTPKIQARLVTKPWYWDTTYNDVEWQWNPTYNSSTYSPCSSSTTADCTLSMDVTKIVRAWYTRRGEDWKPNIGFSLVHEPETHTDWSETDFYMSDAAVADRPALTITYVVPKVEIDFAPELGPNYAPSTMIAGQATTLPVIFSNKNSGFNWNKLPGGGWKYRAGYRFFDAKGKVVSTATGAEDLPADILDNTSSAVFALDITPPATPGSYTLRLDLIHDDSGIPVYASDWASPSLFFSRNKKALSADNTRWTGSSVVERDEFQVGVVAGGGTAVGELRTVELGDGSSVGINLYSRNLHYEGAGGIGFDDLIPLDLSYGYDTANALKDCPAGAADPNGILDACGWYTNWDERMTPDPATAGIYTYQGPSGNRYQVDTDGNGQLISGAPVLLERVRYTGFDENAPVTAGVFVTATSEGVPTVSGSHIYKVPAATTTLISGLGKLDLNAYQHVKFAVRTTDATSSGVAFKIENISDPATYPVRWFVYTVGAGWTPPHSYFAMGGTIVDTWNTTYYDNLYERVRANPLFGKSDHSYQVTGVQIQSNGGAGSTYLDALRILGADTALITDNEPAWTSNPGSAEPESTDFVEGTSSLKVLPTAAAGAPSCQTTCFTALDPSTSADGDIYAMPFVSWQWRKAGGTSVAMEFNLKDTRTNAVGQITYYAGPVPPPGAANPIQVSDTVPVNWTKVTRNVLDDGRQILNFFNDTPTGTGAGAPPSQGPTPDEIAWTGVKPWAPDGVFALVDDLRFGSIPRRDDTDITLANDYVATYPDGSEHWFNRDGLLEEIRDRDANMVALDWTNNGTFGQDAYTLTAVHAPTDATTSGGNTYDRQINVTGGGAWTFTEALGTTATPVAGRSTAFTVDGSSNLTVVKPARQPTCAVSAPTGCVGFDYLTDHRLNWVSDPRWTGVGSGANDYRYQVDWGSGSPDAIQDRSNGSVALLRLVSSALTAAPASRRVVWQDAAAAAADHGIYTDLTSDGSILYDYRPLPCLTSPCAPSTTNLATNRAVANEFDGLARVSTQKQFSSNAGTPLVSRQGTKAAAKVDNYNDPLAAGGVTWTQSPDQHYASMVDGGGDPDLYRTFMTYDAAGNQLTTTTPAYNARPDYAATTKSLPTTTNLKGYWRLGETTGTLAADSAPTPHAGTYVNGVVLGGAGALVGDTNKAPTFDGTNDSVTIPSLGTIQNAFTVSAWAKPGTIAGSQAILGSRGGADKSFDMKFMNGNLIHADIGNGSTWLTTAADAAFTYVANRWYHVVYTVTATEWLIYVNGQLISRGTYPAGAPLLTDATRLIRIGDDGIPGEWFSGQIDEVAIYDVALTSSQVLGHYLAGRSVARHTAQTIYDAEGHPVQVDDQFLENPGFESGTDGWTVSGGAITTSGYVHPPYDPAQPASRLSLRTNLTGKAVQDVALVPGQTARFQLWHKEMGAATARIQLAYWQRSTGAWTSLIDATKVAAGWSNHAWDITLPFDTDGRIRVTLWQAGGAGSDTVYYDDVALLTSYARTKYLADGRTDYAYTFAAADGAGSAFGEIALHPTYAATSVHPAIFATTSVANDVTIPTAPDQDATSTATYDAWGRTLVATDPDGVETESHYLASGSGSKTDVDWTEDGLDNRTTSTFDVVGNQLSSASPTGRTTTRAYDLAGHPVSSEAPDGVISQSAYDAFGMLTTTWANYVDGNPAGGVGIDDVQTSYVYDAAGQVTSTTVNDGGGTAQARTTAAYDYLGRATAATTYATFDGTTFSGTRKTEARPDVSTTYGLTRPGTAGTRGPGNGSTPTAGPLVPTAGPAPACPDASGLFCNGLTGRDPNGLSISLTDAYGKVTRSLNDLAGRPVIVIANYADGVYSSAAPDTDLVAVSQYDIGGRVARTVDVLGRSTQQTFDGLGRSIRTVAYDSGGVATTKTETVYTPAGRIDRVSRPAAYADAASAMAWTRTLYDAAGRAITTLDHDDITGSAGLEIDSFEDGTAAGWTSAAGSLIWAGGSFSVSNCACSIHAGQWFGHVLTGGVAGAGVQHALSGVFRAGRTYRARLWVRSVTTDSPTVLVLLGVDTGGAGRYGSGSFAITTGWQPLEVSWTNTTGSDQTSVAVAIRNSSGALDWVLDDVSVWDEATPDVNIPSHTVYDDDGLPISSILAGGAAGDAPLVTRTAYDAAGRVSSVTVDEIGGAGTPVDANLATTTTYDALGRAVTSTDPTGTVTRYGYDRLGRVTTTWLNYLDGSPSSATAADDVKSTYAYDASGAMIASCPARAVQSTDACDPTNTTTTTTAYKSAWHYLYDEAGHLAKQVPPVKTSGITQLDTKVWTYDPGMRLTKACDAPGGATSCSTADRNSVPTYDAVGRVTVLNTYTGSGTTLALRTESTYRGDGSVEKTKYSEGTTPTLKDTLDYFYDTMGRLDQLKRGTTVLSDFGYNGDGTIASRIDGDTPTPAIGTSAFTYDWADRLLTADLPNTFSGAIPSFAWRLDGLLASRKWSTATAAVVAYDRAKRPTAISKGSLTFGQAYDRDGNVTAESRSLTGVSGDPGTGTQTFAYDALNRVTGSSGLAAGSKSYTYDLDGNRLTATEAGGVTATYAYDRTDQLTSVTPAGGSATVFAYDAFGNLTSNAESISSVTAMTYDKADKLTGIDAAGSANDATFTFDAAGRFRTRVLSGSTDTYSYAGASETVLRISNSSGPTVTDSVVSPSGDRLGVKVGSTLNWLVPELHGNTGAALDAAETTVVNAIRYDAYGETLATGTAGGTAVGTANWKYQGRLDVSPSGLATPLYDMSARFYSPGLGAFTQLDSVSGSAQNPLSMNRFLYALANPATLIDPSGHMSCNYGPDCNLIDYTPPPGMTDGVSPPSKPPPSKTKPPPKTETPPYKGVIPPSGSIKMGIYNPDWQPSISNCRSTGFPRCDIPFQRATLNRECFWNPGRRACDLLADTASWVGPRACGSDPSICLLEFIALGVGGLALVTAGAALAGPSIESANAGAATLVALINSLRDRLQGGTSAPAVNTVAGAAESGAGKALRFPKELIPEGLKQSEWGFQIWGRGPRAALDLIGTRTPDQLRAIGLTPQAAQKLADFYREAAARGLGGEAAHNRVKLMEDIIRTLGGE